MSWLKKMMNYFFDDEEEIEDVEPKEKLKQNPEKKHVSQPFGSEQAKPGKMKNAASGPKMLSDYPAAGNFRFPVIPDELGMEQERRMMNNSENRNPVSQPQPIRNEQSSRPVRKERSGFERPAERRKEEARKERQPRTREPFRPQPVPSPIYGLNDRANLNQDRERTIHNKPESKPNVSQESTPKFIPTDIPSPVYGFKERNKEKIVFPGWSFKEEAKKDHIEDLLSEVPPVPPSEIIEMTEASELNEDVVKVVSVQLEQLSPVEEEQRVEKEITIAPIEESKERELPVFNEKEDHSHHVSSEEHIVSNIQDVHEQDEMEVVELEKPKELPASDEEAAVTSHVPTKKKPGGSYVPFNVMMLKKDRQALKGKGEVPKIVPQKPVLTDEQVSVRVSSQMPKSQPEAPSTVHENERRDHLIPIEFLNRAPATQMDDESWLLSQETLLQDTLNNFNVNAKVVHLTQGPSVTRFEVQPAPGVKVNKITNLTDDIKLSLAARDIRIEAPIPGKNTIGIEVPNRVSRAVYLREIIEDREFIESGSALTVALGLDISGSPVVTDLQKMPHGLIAGATGSGKSVCINSILVSLLYKSSPQDVRLLLVDPKMVELAPYNHIPHLVTPVINDAKEATAALKWAVEEMERRYEDFARTGVRDIKRYNDKMVAEQHYANKMPYLVIVIDELADLMMVSPQDVEESICRIAQKARACGIHLLLATQRPSVDVITGLIKANIPTRAAFAVSSAIDSRTILDMSGAERLLGRGDMLFMENGSNKAVRIQGNFVSDDEIEAVTAYVKEEYPLNYLFSREELIQTQQHIDQEDDLFEEACHYVIDVGAASSSSLQRRFRVGFNRAARLIEMMEAFGLVSEAMGSKPRNVLLTSEEFEERLYADV